jgi:hypothetical protein
MWISSFWRNILRQFSDLQGIMSKCGRTGFYNHAKTWIFFVPHSNPNHFDHEEGSRIFFPNSTDKSTQRHRLKDRNLKHIWGLLFSGILRSVDWWLPTFRDSLSVPSSEGQVVQEEYRGQLEGLNTIPLIKALNCSIFLGLCYPWRWNW